MCFFSMTDLPEMQVVLKIGGSMGFNTKMVYFWMIGGTPHSRKPPYVCCCMLFALAVQDRPFRTGRFLVSSDWTMGIVGPVSVVGNSARWPRMRN